MDLIYDFYESGDNPIIDEYIIEREKQFLIELGLDKMFNKKQKMKK